MDDKVFAGTIHPVITAMNQDEDMSFEEPQMKDRNLLCGGRARQFALTCTGCPNGPEASADGKKELVNLWWTQQPAMTGKGCPCVPGGNCSRKRSFE